MTEQLHTAVAEGAAGSQRSRHTTNDLPNGQGPFERWVRLPKRGVEPHCGLSRPFIYELIRSGQVKSASLKKPGKLTGVRLVWLPSLMAYIEKRIDHPRVAA